MRHLFPIFLLLSFSLNAQNPRDSVPDPIIQLAPQYPGGEAALKAYLRDSFQVPVVNKRVEGKVVATFTIEKDGSVGNVLIVQPLHPAVDSEFRRLLLAMPVWAPGSSNGNPVRVRYTLPLTVNIPAGRQRDANPGNFDVYVSFGDGAWLGSAADAFGAPTFFLDVGGSFRLKKWRLGYALALTNATTARMVLLDDNALPAGQRFAFGWLTAEVQRPLALGAKFVCSPLLGAGWSFTNYLPANESGPEPWGGHLELGVQFDWLFFERAYSRAGQRPATIRQGLRLRSAVLPTVWRDGLRAGLPWFVTLGYTLQGR